MKSNRNFYALNMILSFALLLVGLSVTAQAQDQADSFVSNAPTVSTTTTNNIITAPVVTTPVAPTTTTVIPTTTTTVAPSSTTSNTLNRLSSAVNNTTLPSTQAADEDTKGYVSFKAYVFKVIRGDDPAYYEVEDFRLTAIREFEYGTEGGFKIEGGYNGDSGWGLRGSYFRTNQTAAIDVPRDVADTRSIVPLNTSNIGPTAFGTTASYRENLRIQYFDLEGSYRWKGENRSVLLSAGVRIAPTRQIYTASGIFGGGTESLTYEQKRTGFGPTVAVDFRHRLGGSNFWFTGQGRLSLLFGKIKESATYARAFTFSETRESSRMTPVLEGEVGLEYARKFGGGNNEFFIGGSFAAQNWFKIVNIVPSDTIGSFSPPDGFDDPTQPPTRKGNVGMVGGSFSVGFRF